MRRIPRANLSFEAHVSASEVVGKRLAFPNGYLHIVFAPEVRLGTQAISIELEQYCGSGAFSFGQCAIAEQILIIHWNFGRATRDETLNAPQETKQFDYIPG